MAHIVLHTLGSLGDLHPYLAVARALVVRGHRAVVATHPFYRARVEAMGLEFAPVRPDLAGFGDLADVMALAMDEKRGSRYVVDQLVLPYVRESYDDLLAVAGRADLLVGHVLGFVAPLVAETAGVRRVHAVLQPMAMFSAHDPPVMDVGPLARLAPRLGPGVWKHLWNAGRAFSRPWFGNVATLRRELGLPASGANPMIDLGRDVPNLALFSPAFAPPQPDWPRDTTATGFPIHDRDERGGGLPDELARFLDAGPAPVVFTLGSSAVWNPGGFFEAAVAASRALGVRAVLLAGPAADRFAPAPDLHAAEYAPHSELFARAAAVVHQGGVGTTGQSLRSGRPMVVVPFCHDQPDNAVRCERLGVARVVPRRSASPRRLARALEAVLADAALARRAAELGARVRAEDGAAAAALALERVLGHRARAA